MRIFKQQIKVKIYAFCLMPNHYHFVMTSENGWEISRWIHRVMTKHASRYHNHFKTCGHIWQSRFRNFLVQEDFHLLKVLRYVERNPLSAGLVLSAHEWPWSSHNFHNKGIANENLDELPFPIPQDWTKIVNAPLSEEDLIRIEMSISRQTPFGNEEWVKERCKLYNLEQTLRPRGRPKKQNKNM